MCSRIPFSPPLHMEKELISIKGVPQKFWQDINSTVVLVQEIIDQHICTSLMQICDGVSNSMSPHCNHILLLQTDIAQGIFCEILVLRDAFTLGGVGK